VLWREEAGQLLVAVVHRERYDDWSLPKGKLDSGESTLSAAVREVGEETGAAVNVSRRLGQVRYLVDGIDKSVRFWAMRYRGGEFEPSDEVDKLEWLTVDEARRQLTYVGEQMMIGALTAVAVPTAVVIVVRHAKAGKRSEWKGADRQRPLESRGRTQARALADQLSSFGPTRILSAEPLRCVQTVEPLAHRLDLELEIDPAFSDRTSAVDQQRSRDALHQLVRADRATVVCTQGDTIKAVLGQVAAKGSAWVLGCRAGEIVSSDYYGATRATRATRRYRG
jgi:broad specificity phosphatase PhoE/predicted NUDIX family NTP pyrophosphohydrolase